MKLLLELVEKGVVPTPLVRLGIRRLLRQRLREEVSRHGEDREGAIEAWLESMRASPIALVPEKANEQHYELPPEFFRLVLGPHLKYSSALFAGTHDDLGRAEAEMLALTCERAQLADGQRILELGCGWGSLTLWMAARYPNSTILAVSNSAPQRRFIEALARKRGLDNVEVVTADMNGFDTPRRFDRLMSVEMFEHMRNWEALLERAQGWLAPEGRAFVHVFAHRRFAYPFEVRDESDWMSEFFFSGGMMPSDDLLERARGPLEVEDHWTLSGTHYARTSEAWLANLEAHRDEALAILRDTYGEGREELWYQRWRLFFLACAELFGFRGGSEWVVSHYRLRHEVGVRAGVLIA